jgi:hypothetical protein
LLSEDKAKQYCPDSKFIGTGNVKLVATAAFADVLILSESTTTIELGRIDELGIPFSSFLTESSTGSLSCLSLKNKSILVRSKFLSTKKD